MVFCGKPANRGNRTMGTSHGCFKKGVGTGIGIGIERGEVSGKKKGKKVGKVLGEITGRKKGIKIGVRKMKFGKSLTIPELNSLSKDQLRDIVLRRKRTNKIVIGAVSRLSKAALKTALETNLRARNELKL